MNVQPIWDTLSNLLPSPYPNLLRPRADTCVEFGTSTLGFRNGGRGSDEQRLPFVSWSGSLPYAEEHYTSLHTLCSWTHRGPAQCLGLRQIWEDTFSSGQPQWRCLPSSFFFFHKGLQKSCAPDSPKLRARAQMKLSLRGVCSDVDRTSLCTGLGVWASTQHSTELLGLCFQV